MKKTKKSAVFESTDYTDSTDEINIKESCESCQNPEILSKKSAVFESTDYTDFTDEINTKESCESCQKKILKSCQKSPAWDSTLLTVGFNLRYRGSRTIKSRRDGTVAPF